MKKIAVAFLFCLTSTIANAQSGQLPPGFITTNKPVLCGPADTIFKGLADQEIDEKPLWVGTSENNTNFAVFVNTKTQGFTVLQFGETIGCILGIGPKSITFNLPKAKSM